MKVNTDMPESGDVTEDELLIMLMQLQKKPGGIPKP